MTFGARGRRLVTTTSTIITVFALLAITGCNRKSRSVDGGADHKQNCVRILLELKDYKNRELTYDEAMAEVRRMRLKTDNGIAECKAANDPEAVALLEDFRRQIDGLEADAEQAKRNAVAAQNGVGAGLDPTSCPKGRVMIDPASGKTVHCTGAASVGTTGAGPNDDGDIRASCTRVKDTWNRTDGIDPIIDCTSEASGHVDIKIVVTNAGWDYLGEHGKRKAFAQSIIDAFKSHWKTFHAWNGADPSGHQVHLWRMNGADLALTATMSASGFYLE
jgi:hypothetical protein